MLFFHGLLTSFVWFVPKIVSNTLLQVIYNSLQTKIKSLQESVIFWFVVICGWMSNLLLCSIKLIDMHSFNESNQKWNISHFLVLQFYGPISLYNVTWHIQSLTCFFFCLSLSLRWKISLSGGIWKGLPLSSKNSSESTDAWLFALEHAELGNVTLPDSRDPFSPSGKKWTS